MSKKSNISVPQGYFEDLEQRLQSIPSRPARVTVVQKVTPWLAYAASLALLVAVGNYVFRTAAQPESEFTQEYIAYLSQSLDPDGMVDIQEPGELSEEEIVSYLVADNVSILETLNYEEDY